MAGYSFIDIAVLEPVRARFVAGDALILLDETLDTAIWANGGGAALLGHDRVEAAIGVGTDFSPAARRQIMATPGFPLIGDNRTVIVRIGQGASRAVLFRASGVELPSGEHAILLAAPLADATQAGAQIVSGLNGPDEEAALLDESGAVLAATPGFAASAPSPAAMGDLVRDTAKERDRLVKRIVPGKAGKVGAGVARLADEPARYLMVIVADADDSGARHEAVVELAGPAPMHPLRTETLHPQVDGWYFSGEDDRRSAPSQAAPAGPMAADPSAQPVRFVWRTDADGRFSAVSPEFAQAVGQPAADIIGRSFGDVARVFDLDPSGEVAGLLARRDTWSGRTVLWPVSATNRKVPVDLAALPAYSRDRNFDGFRGFGVVRMADAVIDPEAIGMSLTSAAGGETSAHDRNEMRPHGANRDPFLGETPALAETPQVVRPLPDKVVRLAERRAATAERELSQVEKLAFREIGDRLKTDEPRSVDANEAGKSGEPDGGSVAAPELADADSAQPERDLHPAEGGENVIAETPLAPASEPVAISEEPGEPENTAAHGAGGAALLSRLPLPMLVHSGDRLHYANDEFLERTGYASLDDLVEAGGIGALIAGPYPANDDEPARRRPVRLVSKDGHEHAVEAHLQSIPWDDGRALLLSLRPAPVVAEETIRTIPADPVMAHAGIAVATESPPEIRGATPPVPAESDAALVARVAELETILDTATDGIVTLDHDGSIRSVSRAAQALFGFEAGDLAGKPFVSLFATESQRAARDYLAGLTENGVASVLNDGREVIGREAKGGFIPLFMTIGRLPGDSGFCAVLRDITQFKRAEEELTQARRKAEAASSQKSDFLARVSHEIRTPLNAIIGFSELMLDEKFGPVGSDRYRDYLRDINKSGNHVLDLVNDLLDISKIEAGQQDLSYEAVRLNETLSDAVSLMQPQANRERVIIRSSLSSNLPEVVADLRSVKQIALNLLSNAVRFTNPGGQVIVSTAYEPSGDVVMRVRDTGVGMSRAEIEQALKPFKQIATLKRPRGDGTGLGLPLTKAMVEANRAGFAISSTPGEGTMVEVTFPSTRVLAG